MAETAADTAEWVARAREGDEAAARALVESLHPLVLKIVRSHRPVRTDEEDLAQIVFSRVFAHLDQYTGTVPIELIQSRHSFTPNSAHNVFRRSASLSTPVEVSQCAHQSHPGLRASSSRRRTAARSSGWPQGKPSVSKFRRRRLA